MTARPNNALYGHMTDAFLRQRRNLFIANILLIVLATGGVQLEQLTFAGMTFGAFTRPEVFLVGAWVAFGYFLYRYIVYFREVSPSQLRELWERESESAVNPRIKQLISASHPTVYPNAPFSYLMLRRSKGVYFGQISLGQDGHGGERMDNIQVAIPRHKILAWELKGLSKFLLLTPAPTEHLLPFVLSAGTFVYCGFIAKWAGNVAALAA